MGKNSTVLLEAVHMVTYRRTQNGESSLVDAAPGTRFECTAEDAKWLVETGAATKVESVKPEAAAENDSASDVTPEVSNDTKSAKSKKSAPTEASDPSDDGVI